MNTRQFYRECYLKTAGWLPMVPLTNPIALGDFCQIQQSRVVPLGNILDLNLVEDVDICEVIELNREDWKLSSGVHQTFCETEQLIDEKQQRSEWTKQVLSFDEPGSFVFHSQIPLAQLILNFSEFKKDITVKLTQSHHSFREVFVVTEVAVMENWGLAIADRADAQLEISAQTRSTHFFDLMSHRSSRAEQSKDISTFERHIEQPGYFFKAKKLVLSDYKKEYYIRHTMSRREHLAPAAIAAWLNGDMLNQVVANELNIATCLDFFDWVDMSLDDVEKLC